MAYKMVTRARDDGSTETFKEYHRSKFIAFLLGFLFGALGLHFLYARNFVYFWLMLIFTFSIFYAVPYESVWSYSPAAIGLVTSLYYLAISKEKFFNIVNGYDS